MSTVASHSPGRTEDFWSNNPCGSSDSDFLQVQKQRYKVNYFIPQLIQSIDFEKIDSMVELGCGQGVDAAAIIQNLKPGASYLGMDLSSESIRRCEERSLQLGLSQCEFQVGDISDLSAIPSESMDFVYSMGVIHHTGKNEQVIREIHRILKPEGKGYIFLYNSRCPKVFVCKWLRAIQHALDKLTGQDRFIYRHVVSKFNPGNWFGTMFHECFGVPILDSFTDSEMKALFKDFECEVTTVGGTYGLPFDFARYMQFAKIQGKKPAAS